MTVNFLFRAAFLRNASTVLELPIVRMNSLQTRTSQSNVEELRNVKLTQNEYDPNSTPQHSDESSQSHQSIPESPQ